MEQPELADDPRFHDHHARGVHQDELDALIADWAAVREADELGRILDEHNVPTSKVNDIADVFADPLFRERDMLVEVSDEEDTVTHPGIVPRLTRTPGSIRWNGPSEVGGTS